MLLLVAAGTLALAVGVAVAATTGRSGGAITAVKVVRGPDAQTTNSTSFVNLPAATTTINVPAGHKALLLLRFSAESECDGGSWGDYCSVQLTVDSHPAAPATGFDFAFDTDAGVASNYPIWQSSSMDRSAIVGPGSHVVRVQWGVTAGTTTFRLDDWSLTVERSIK